jgi:hypothetical protein
MHDVSPEPDDKQPTAPASSDDAPAPRTAVVHDPARRAHLKRVLDEVRHAMSTPRDRSLLDIKALRQLAARHRDEVFTLDPVAIEMTRVMVERIFRTDPASSPDLMTMCRTIAETLWHDERSKLRLERLWSQIQRQMQQEG